MDKLGDLRSALVSLQADDTRLQSIGWRLAEGNAGFCPDTQPQVGLLPLDARSFKKPDDIRAALGLGGEFAVQAVAAGSPAALAMLKPGDELLKVEGRSLSALPRQITHSDARLEMLQDSIAAALAANGEVRLEAHGGGETRMVRLKGVPACKARIVLLTGGKTIEGGDSFVRVSRFHLGIFESDAELAFLVAHEMAHGMLGHPAWLRKAGKSAANVRLTERAADRLAVWLMANANFDLAGAGSFMERWGRRQGSPLFRAATHDRWQVRQAAIHAERLVVETARAALPGARLDWRERFPR